MGRGGAEGSPGEVVPLLLRVWLLLLFAGYTEGLKGTNCHSSDSSEPRRKSSSRRRRNFDRNVFITMAWPTLRERVACGRHCWSSRRCGRGYGSSQAAKVPRALKKRQKLRTVVEAAMSLPY